MCLPISLVCSASWGEVSDYNLVPSAKTVRGSNHGGGEIFRTCPDRLWAHPAYCTKGIGSFPGVKSDRGVTLTPPSAVLNKQNSCTSSPLWALRPERSVSACTTRVHLTLRFTLPQRGTGTAGSTLVKVLYYKSEGRWFDSSSYHLIFL